MNEFEKALAAHKLDWSTPEKSFESLRERERLEHAVVQANLEAAIVARGLWTLEEYQKFTWFQKRERV
jgi:hypothetical protein